MVLSAQSLPLCRRYWLVGAGLDCLDASRAPLDASRSPFCVAQTWLHLLEPGVQASDTRFMGHIHTGVPLRYFVRDTGYPLA